MSGDVERQVRVGAATVYYHVAGQGLPLVLLHGLAGSRRWWARNVPALSQQFQTFAVDLLGFGRGRGQRFVLREAAEVLRGWMDALGLARVALAGHSLGGFIAADLAARAPEHIERLVLVDAAALPIGRSYSRHAFGLARSLPWTPPDFLPVLLADAWLAGPRTVWHAAREIVSADLTAALSRITAPTLVVWGEQDRLLPLALGRTLERALPDARLALIPGAGHNPMWDRPAEFNRVVLEFLAAPPGEAGRP